MSRATGGAGFWTSKRPSGPKPGDIRVDPPVIGRPTTGAEFIFAGLYVTMGARGGLPENRGVAGSIPALATSRLRRIA
jgi:hypothetical protein